MDMRPIPSHKLTWFVCCECGRVRARTGVDLQELNDKGHIPLCTDCEDGVGRFMRRISFEETIIDELKGDMETLLSLAVEVKKNNTDEFMIYFKGRVNGLVSKYFEGDCDETTIQTT